MLDDFLTSNRDELIKRCREKESKRLEPGTLPDATGQGVPLFLEQLVDTLRQEKLDSAKNFGKPHPLTPAPIGHAAALHGAELLRRGYSIDQVVHDYGDVCQSVTEMALEQKSPIATNEFRILNRCLDDAIAGAVTAFGNERQAAQVDSAEAHQHELNAISEDQQRLIDTAIHAFSAVRTGSIGLSGATGTVLMHTLLELRDLAKRVAKTALAPDPAVAIPKP